MDKTLKPHHPRPHDQLATLAREILAHPMGEDYTHFREMMAWEIQDTMPEMSAAERRDTYGHGDALERAQHLLKALGMLVKGEKNVDKPLDAGGPTIRSVLADAGDTVGMFIAAEGSLIEGAAGMKKKSNIAGAQEGLGGYSGQASVAHVRREANKMVDASNESIGRLLEIRDKLTHLVSVFPPQQELG